MIIFLDVDGVLNQLQRWYIDENCVKILAKICNHFNARIILTSTYRKWYYHKHDKCSKQVQDLIFKLSKYNLRISGISITELLKSKILLKHNINLYLIMKRVYI